MTVEAILQGTLTLDVLLPYVLQPRVLLALLLGVGYFALSLCGPWLLGGRRRR